MNANETNEAVYYTCLIFIYSFAAAYAATIYLNIPLPMYFPIQNAWSMTPAAAGAPSQKWYAMLGFAFAVSAFPTAAAWLVSRNFFARGRSASERSSAIAAMIMWFAVSAILIYVVSHEVVRWKIF